MLLLFLYTCTVFWMATMAESNSKKADKIPEYAIQDAKDGSYPPELTKEKERAVRKRAALLTVDKGEVSFNSGKTKVIVIISLEEQRRVLKACHSEPTSGHFGVTKTYKRMAERVHIFQRKSSRGPYSIKK